MKSWKQAVLCLLGIAVTLTAADPLLGDLGLDSQAARSEKAFSCSPAPEAKAPAVKNLVSGIDGKSALMFGGSVSVMPADNPFVAKLTGVAAKITGMDKAAVAKATHVL